MRLAPPEGVWANDACWMSYHVLIDTIDKYMLKAQAPRRLSDKPIGAAQDMPMSAKRQEVASFAVCLRARFSLVFFSAMNKKGQSLAWQMSTPPHGAPCEL